MRTAVMVRLLRIMSTIAVNICVYAAAATLRTALFGTDGGFEALGLFFFTMILAHVAAKLFIKSIPGFITGFANTRPVKFLMFILNIRNASSFISTLLAWTACMVPITVTFFLYGRHNVLRFLFELLPIIITYIISLKHTGLSAYQIMNNRSVCTCFIILALCLEVPLFFERLGHLRNWVFAASYCFMFVFLIVKNQEDIDVNIYSKRHIEKSILPGNLRRVNAATACVVFFAILLLFNFKKIVITLVNWAIIATVAVVWGINWLMYQILQVRETVMGEGLPEQSDFPEFIPESSSLLVNIIFYTLSIVIMLFAFYMFLRFFIKWFPDFCRKIAGLVSKIFAVRNVKDEAEESDFHDEIEKERPVSITHTKRKVLKDAAVGIRALKREKDPVKRIRLMYSILLRMLPTVGIRPEQSDTTLEIVRKASAEEGVCKELTPFTDIYNQVRYGGKGLDQEQIAKAGNHFARAAGRMGKSFL